MGRLRKHALIALVFLIVFVYPFCSWSRLSPDEKKYFDNNPVIVFCVYSNMPPMSFVDEDGEYKGYLIDYIRTISIRFGFMVRFVSSSRQDMCRSVSGNVCHVALGVFLKKEEFPPLNLMESKSMVELPIFAFTLKGSSIKGPEDLYGKRIAIYGGCLAGGEVEGLGVKATYIMTDGIEKAFKMLKEGKVDAVAGVAPVMLWMSKKLGIYRDLSGEGISLGSVYVKMLVKKGDAILLGVLNRGISYIKGRDIEANIERKWFGTVYRISHGAGRYAKSALVAVVVLSFIVLLVILWNISLSREVKKRTEELSASERRYKSLVNNLNIGVFRVNLSKGGELIEVNPSFIFMFGYASKNEIVGRRIEAFFEDPSVGREILKAMEEKGIIKGEVVSAKRKDGTIFLVSINAVLEKEGGTLFADGSAEDVTEKIKMEEEMLKSSRLESLSVLAGGIAHDFNNILTSLLGNITLAKEKAGDAAKKYLQEAEKSIARAANLTKQLLTFAKGGEPIKKKVDISKLLRDSVSFALRGSNVKPLFSIPGDLPQIEVDEAQISQVINNVVINSKQSMPEGGYIQVKAEEVYVRDDGSHPSLNPGRYIRITISDQGSGIPKDVLPKVFDPFFTTRENASGLGLSTCYSILKKHRGGIEIESEEGKGTDVYIYLPVFEGVEEARPVERKKDVKGGKILVVDDEEDIRNICRDFLSTLGFTVDVAGDGIEAISIFKSSMDSGSPFDLVILDLTIPGGMGGVDVLKRLKNMDPQIKAIVVSGYSTDPVLSRFREYGFSGALVKPFMLKDLEKTVKEVMAS